MKKIVALFMACAMMLSMSAFAKKGSSAKLYFSKPQFQVSHTTTTKYNGYPALTFPLVYTGSVKFTGWIVSDGIKKCVQDEKITPDLIMTICQPCIDCYPCVVVPTMASEEPALVAEPAKDPQPITAWNLYVVVNYKDGKKKATFVEKIDLIAAGTVFFTGQLGKEPGVIQYLTDKAQLLVGGKKSDYSFTYYQTTFGGTEDGGWDGEYSWDESTTASSSSKGYIKSIAELKGSLNLADAIGDGAGFQLNGAVTLKRDAKLTDMAVKAIFTTTATSKSSKNWEDCGGDAGHCEQYFQADGNYDFFDEYVEDKYSKTLDDDIAYSDTLDTLYEDIYAAIYGDDLDLGDED